MARFGRGTEDFHFGVRISSFLYRPGDVIRFMEKIIEVTKHPFWSRKSPSEKILHSVSVRGFYLEGERELDHCIIADPGNKIMQIWQIQIWEL